MTDLRLGSLVVEDHGSGAALLALHGLGGSSNTFETLMAALGSFRVLRPDWPGAGRSGPLSGRGDVAGLVAVALDALRLAGVERAHVIGHSMGALVAQQLAAKCPECVSGLTLFGPLLEPPPAARVALRERAEAARAHGMAGIASAVAQASVADASGAAARAFVRESLTHQSPDGYARHCEALAEAGAAAHADIACPALLVAGERDPVAPVGMVRDLAGRIDGARVEVLPAVGHWMTIEAPRRCTELLLGALADH